MRGQPGEPARLLRVRQHLRQRRSIHAGAGERPFHQFGACTWSRTFFVASDPAGPVRRPVEGHITGAGPPRRLLNYLSVGKVMNSVYLSRPSNVDGGDGRDTWVWLSRPDQESPGGRRLLPVHDVSKLAAQWERRSSRTWYARGLFSSTWSRPGDQRTTGARRWDVSRARCANSSLPASWWRDLPPILATWCGTFRRREPPTPLATVAHQAFDGLDPRTRPLRDLS